MARTLAGLAGSGFGGTAGAAARRRPRRVVLLGGGYVTLHAYRTLTRRLRSEVRRGDVEVVVVSADHVHNFHGFTGEVVAGLLPIGLTQAPLTKAMPLAQVLHARALRVDTVGRRVHYLADDGREGRVRYDALVVATGGGEPVHDVPGLAEHAATLRGPGDLARTVARVAGDGGTENPVVVVGGGLAGVELAGALAGREVDPPRVVLVHGGEQVVPALRGPQPRLAARVDRELDRLGVEVRTGVRVVGVDAEAVTLSDGARVPAGTVLATTGQRARVVPGLEHAETDRLGRLRTTPGLAVVGVSGVWAAGDVARVAQGPFGEPVPANALWAIKAGDHVGRNVARALRGEPQRDFRYGGLGQGASFGVGHGIAELYGVPLTGWLAWIARLVFFLRFMPSKANAVRVPFALMAAVRAGRRAVRPDARRVPVVALPSVAPVPTGSSVAPSWSVAFDDRRSGITSS